MEKLLAVTAIGTDRTGLVEDVSRTITSAGGNILESRMTTLGSEFAVLALVSGNWHAISKVRDNLAQLEQKADLTLTIRDTESRAPGASAPYVIDIVSLDREGIVAGLAGFFAGRNFEIAELNTRTYNAPHTGAAMFSIQMIVNIPSAVPLASLREEFHQYCDEENLDSIMEPAQR